MTTKNLSKLDAFWESVPDETTIIEMANGILVEFYHDGNKYTVNTRHPAGRFFRTRSLSDYYEYIDNLASNCSANELELSNLEKYGVPESGTWEEENL